jgi:hypothetical protein
MVAADPLQPAHGDHAPTTPATPQPRVLRISHRHGPPLPAPPAARPGPFTSPRRRAVEFPEAKRHLTRAAARRPILGVRRGCRDAADGGGAVPVAVRSGGVRLAGPVVPSGPPCATSTPARRTGRRCSGSASWPGTTAAPASGACSTTPARTASRRSPRAASTTRAGSSACTMAGASTAPAPANSSPRPPPSGPRYASLTSLLPLVSYSSRPHIQTAILAAGAHEQKGVRGVVPLRGAEQHPLVLPEIRHRIQGRATDEAATVHS